MTKKRKKKNSPPLFSSLELRVGNKKELKFNGNFEKVIKDTVDFFTNKYGYDLEELVYGSRKRKKENRKNTLS